jgi:hypothetical protein
MWIRLPTPFKRGDIVTAPTGWRLPPTVYEGYEGPFVLDDICYWNKGENGEYEGCDSSDMHAHGYWVDEDGMVASQFMYAYQDIEYYRGELIGDLRMLTAISNFMKGEINDCALLLNAYEVVRNERYLRDSQLAMNMFNDRRIGLTGLTPQRKRGTP